MPFTDIQTQILKEILTDYAFNKIKIVDEFIKRANPKEILRDKYTNSIKLFSEESSSPLDTLDMLKKSIIEPAQDTSISDYSPSKTPAGKSVRHEEQQEELSHSHMPTILEQTECDRSDTDKSYKVSHSLLLSKSKFKSNKSRPRIDWDDETEDIRLSPTFIQEKESFLNKLNKAKVEERKVAYQV